jgi:hypothetical protein
MPIIAEITELESVYPADYSDGYGNRVVPDGEREPRTTESFSHKNVSPLR